MTRRKFENHPELPYHITARCINRDWFSQDLPHVWDITTRHLYFTALAFDLRIHSFVLMSNHFHMIVRSPQANLSEAMQYFMRATGNDLREISGRINQTYGGRFHRSLITHPHHYDHAYKYVYRNPVEAGQCERVQDYPYSTIQALMGRKMVEVPVLEDPRWGTWEDRVQTLRWLNSKPHEDNWESVRKALRKGVFALPKMDSRSSPLEDCAL
ncbi:transposase [Bdellovibrio sp.]|uniref:transposase n=1 Tax=Bdellovibrio TaxID=958 RepID=UPI003221DADB